MAERGTTRRPETMLVMGEDWLRTQFGAAELARLAAAATLADPIAATELSSPPARARLAVVEVLITSWGCPPLDRAVLGNAPRLRAVLHAAGSVRGHVGQAVFDRGILVTTAADANAQPVARYTLAAILWAAKKVPFLAADARVHRDDWSYRHEHGELGGSLTVVLVGFSRVGRRVARLLHLIGVTGVLVVDPFADPAAVAATGAELVTLEEALPRAGVLSLHAPHLPATRHMIGDAELAALPPGATLINTARGGLVDHAALERACLAGLHAILDVTEPEPLPPASVLYELPNVMVTPHVAGSLGAETRLLAASALTELERYAAGLPPLDAVTAQSLELQALGGVIVMLPGPSQHPADLGLSPYTGWTRAHWEATADQLLLAVRPHAGPGNALIGLPGPASRAGAWSDGLEGFARTFLLAAFRLAGAGGRDRRGLADWYAAGLATGTDPAAPQRWPRLDEIDQAKVEAASIVIALHETRPWIWDRLDDAVRARVLEWLAAFAGAWVPDNNWVWFRAVAAAFSRSAGGTWDQADIEHAIARTEDWYRGDGWYSDGGTRNFDHYNGWAMHLYPLWYCRIAGDLAEPGLAERYRDRLRRYLSDAAHLVGGDGAPLFQGRSLTYRFAALAPFWAGAVFDATPLAPGLTRRIASGMLRYFLSAGCLRADGTLSIGWHGEFLPIRQPYSGPGSPYWAAKGFAGLLLPADGPVWQSAEEPLPVERGDFTRIARAPGWVISGTSADGIVRVANHGTDHAHSDQDETYDPFYSRLTYATRTGPDVSGDVDSGISLIDADGRASRRRRLQPVRAEGRTGISRHQACWPSADGQPSAPGPWLTTASVVHGCWEVRLVRVEQDAVGRYTLRIGGWPVPADQPPDQQAGPGAASVRGAGGLTSCVIALHGTMFPGVHRPAGPHAFGPQAAVPYLSSATSVLPGETYAAAVALSAASAASGEPPRLTIEPGKAGHVTATVRWADGEQDQLTL
jgi:phosphoglycerate dehydrogenase-like enzyme